MAFANHMYLTNVNFNNPNYLSIHHQRLVHPQVRHPLHRVFYHWLPKSALPDDLKYNSSLRLFESFAGLQLFLEDSPLKLIIDFTKMSLTYDNMLLQVNNELPTLREGSERLRFGQDILDMFERMAQFEWETQMMGEEIGVRGQGELGPRLRGVRRFFGVDEQLMWAQDVDELFMMTLRLSQIDGQRMGLGLALWKSGYDRPGEPKPAEEDERRERYIFELRNNELPEGFSKGGRFDLMGLDELSALLDEDDRSEDEVGRLSGPGLRR